MQLLGRPEGVVAHPEARPASRWVRIELALKHANVTQEAGIQVEPARVDLEQTPTGVLWQLGPVSIRLSAVVAVELARALSRV